MLTCHRQNTHRHKLPKPANIGFIVGLSTVDPHRRCIVSHFPLSDVADQRFCRGIHTCVVRFLDNGEQKRLSGFWFKGDGE